MRLAMVLRMVKLGKEQSFFDLLESQANVAVKAAEAYVALVGDLSKVQGGMEALEVIEHEGDEVTHTLQRKIASTFITPLDQEDLSALSHLLDDITDSIEAVGARMGMYKLKELRPDLVPFAANLLEVTRVTAAAVSELRHQFARSATLPETLVKIHTLENESDRLYRQALTLLFDEAKDPITVSKWKEVYDRVENATDTCESVANLIDNMIVKYA
jgi:predicted phosphate transport protein (TIGR00153 family)